MNETSGERTSTNSRDGKSGDEGSQTFAADRAGLPGAFCRIAASAANLHASRE